MDSHVSVDSIQVEKSNAHARYRRFNNIAKMLKLIRVCFAVVLISWSSARLPTVFKVVGEYLYACSSYLLNQHVVFLVGNFIVVLCYVLSGHIEVGNESAGPEVYEGNEHRYVSNHITSEPDLKPAAPPVEELPVMETAEEKIEEKVVRNENVIVKTESEVAAEMAIKQAAKQIERFQRTQSAKLKREISMKPRRELSRSVTERRRNVVDTTGDDADSPVEKLSNEEFRLAVEAFILKQQSLIKQQTMVENSYPQ